jgi:hypothetical protein
MTHVHESPVEGGANPCPHCPPIPTQAPMSKIIAVGFGAAQVYCDDEFVADGETGIIIRNGEADKLEDYLTFADVEEMAVLRPGNWTVVLHGPRHGETYQRQGVEQWVCIERNDGFA